ncbi:hypothetical protein [Bradyrhizobium lablabi]|uniref:Uncharacterized protein n=1 Tax=Bradyrhizobium lablabi TaxID=722472 RepID=A0A1H5JMR6_9BRAD|nr:hypothetical protein [Bradyrhizobium lablabi]SEE51736.1 hypothetical protein SAMN05444171_7820 [Bradyrhizobium lablabi]SEE53261.1 hypothetical protein SAMN05444171_7887 [Bradyrhizobium lablabi]
MSISFEWSFRAGEVLTFAGTMIGGLGVAAVFFYRRGGDDTELKAAVSACLKEISEMKTELSEFGKAMTRMAVQETKIDLLMKWYDELRRCQGFVKGERGIDREFP